MQLSKIEGFSAIVGIVLAFIAGSSYIVILRDDIGDLTIDINNLNNDIKELKNKELDREDRFEKLKNNLSIALEKQEIFFKKERNNLDTIKNKLEKKYKTKKDTDKFIAQELLDESIEDFNNKKYHLSISKNKKILDKFPNDIEALLYLSKSYNKVGKIENAFSAIKKAYKLNNNNEDVLYELGFLYERKNRYKKSLEYFIKAYELNPENIKFFYRLSYYNRKTGNYEKALFFAEKHLEIYPDYGGYSLRGKALFKLARYNDAIKDLEKAVFFGKKSGISVKSPLRMIKEAKEKLLVK